PAASSASPSTAATGARLANSVLAARASSSAPATSFAASSARTSAIRANAPPRPAWMRARRALGVSSGKPAKTVVEHHRAGPFLHPGAERDGIAVGPDFHHQRLARENRLGETHIELDNALRRILRHGGKNGAACRAIGTEPVQDGTGKAHHP